MRRADAPAIKICRPPVIGGLVIRMNDLVLHASHYRISRESVQVASKICILTKEKAGG